METKKTRRLMLPMYIWLGLFDIRSFLFMCVRVTYQSLWQTV